jgi:hypothetical protein
MKGSARGDEASEQVNGVLNSPWRTTQVQPKGFGVGELGGSNVLGISKGKHVKCAN